MTGLSEAGVELGLARHLETDATDAEIRRLVGSTTPAARVHVVLSANVFVGASRALALALAAAPSVFVRPSRREPVMACLLARALREKGLDVTLVNQIAADAGDQVHVYGREQSIRAIATLLPSGVALWAHGAGMGLAVVEDEDDPREAADLLAWDVIAFDQRGCLSPRLVLWSGGVQGAMRFGHALAEILEERAVQIPRGHLDAEETAQASLYANTVEMVGTCWRGASSMVGLEPEPRAAYVPPPGRNVHICCVQEPRLPVWLSPLAPLATTLGSLSKSHLASALEAAMPWVRLARLGAMQRPAFDGPVDLRSSLNGLARPSDSRRGT